MNEEAHDLFSLASDDYKALKSLIKMDLISHVIFFLAQQTVEKCMKSVLANNNVIYPKIHNLMKIKQLLVENDIKSNFPDDILKQLIPFAADCRYGMPEVEFPEAKEVLAVAKSAIDWCKEQIHD